MSPKNNLAIQNLNYDLNIATKEGSAIRKKNDFRGAFKN